MRIVSVSTKEKSYEIIIDKKSRVEFVEDILQSIEKKAIIVTDNFVEELYKDFFLDLKKSSKIKSIISFEHGEENKNLKTMDFLYKKILKEGINKQDIIISIGGGVVGDVAGFLASTILRGVEFIQVPTTLLSQVDSSVGGKVGINTDFGKNLIGSFYQPKKVLINTKFLDTLSKEDFACGMAEVIKYACIASKDMWNYLFNIDKEDIILDINKLVELCCKIKSEFVLKDEKDMGVRKILNFGHTIGHAIESYFEYGKYNHGQAISLGMLKIFEYQNLDVESLKFILKKFNLQTKFPKINMDLFIEIMCKDKKSFENEIEMVFLENIGEAKIELVNKNDLKKFFKKEDEIERV